jgi:hypothetical protein
MGSAGMKRKGRRHLPKVEGDVSADDVGRLFGRFRWGGYTPGGTVERAGFFSRQVARNGSADGWVWGFGAMRLVVPVLVVVALAVFLVAKLLG